MRTLHLLAMAALVGAGLTACGDSDDNGDPPVVTREVPAAAAASSESYTQYVQDRPADEDSTEPLGLNLFADAPTSETASPVDFD